MAMPGPLNPRAVLCAGVSASDRLFVYATHSAVFADDTPAPTASVARGEAGGVHHVCRDGAGRVAAVLRFDAAAKTCDVSFKAGAATDEVVAAVIDLAERLSLQQTRGGNLTIECGEDDEALTRWLLIRGYTRLKSSRPHRQQYHVNLATAPPGV